MYMESYKNDRKDNKLQWELLPLRLIEHIVAVYTFGAKKYKPNSWQNLPDGYNRYKAAMLRHLTAYEKGETKDPESNLHPLAHMAWNALALLYLALTKNTPGKIPAPVPKASTEGINGGASAPAPVPPASAEGIKGGDPSPSPYTETSCGSCKLFENEDIEGIGWCTLGGNDTIKNCTDTCKYFEPHANDN